MHIKGYKVLSFTKFQRKKTLKIWKARNTVLPQIMAWAFISFQQLFTLATKQDWRLYWCLLLQVLNQSFLGDKF